MPVNALDHYEMRYPEKQNIVDLFDGEWSSQFPVQFGLRSSPGTAALFADTRIDWAIQQFGGISNSQVLELGPLEGGHTYMFHRNGAKSILSIEANTRAFLKCLCVKEMFALHNAEFRLGDFVSFMEKHDKRFDAAFASGVLYHMEDPLKFLDLLCRSSDKVYIWTVYYDRILIPANESVAHKFSAPKFMSYGGVEYEYSDFAYLDAVEWKGFCGGPKPQSKWLTREGILSFLKEAKFTRITTGIEQPDHPNGPAFAICAQR